MFLTEQLSNGRWAGGSMSVLATPSALITPYGGHLVNLMVAPELFAELKAYANTLPSILLSERSIYDLELLATGAFSPLDQFMSRDDFLRVLADMRLASGHIFPIPITLPIDADVDIQLGHDVALRSSKNEILAVMTVEEVYEWDLADVVGVLYGTQDVRHPMIAEMHRWGKRNIAGRLQVLHLPAHYDFQDLRLTPLQTRARLEAMGQGNVIAFQSRDVLHRAHEEFTKRVAQEVNGLLLLQPVVGMTQPGDIGHYTRVRTYKILAGNNYQAQCTLLALLPLAMRMAGPREALWHALIHRNYGANHLIVDRDYAHPDNDAHGVPFYGPDEAQQLVERYSEELGVRVVPFPEFVYLDNQERYEEVSRISPQDRVTALSATQVRENYLNKGVPLPAWFVRPEVAAILAEMYPSRHRQGVCIWFTGLSGAGKSTTAEILTTLLLEHGRVATVLDGDVVRTHLSRGLGFSKEDRDTNIRRIGYVAAEIVRHGGIVICAAVSPYRATRNDVRRMMGLGQFIEVFVDTPLDVCEDRDVKGMYAKARRGEIRDFTGIDDPYEVPEQPEITLGTVARTAAENAYLLLNYIIQQGFVR
jgi:sulfate adenylyltransferase